jgi:hypothetical protein
MCRGGIADENTSWNILNGSVKWNIGCIPNGPDPGGAVAGNGGSLNIWTNGSGLGACLRECRSKLGREKVGGGCGCGGGGEYGLEYGFSAAGSGGGYTPVTIAH